MKPKPVPWACIYGCIKGEEPSGGVWRIHKHIPTGKLLGPSVVFGVPTTMVFARQTIDGWKELVA